MTIYRLPATALCPALDGQRDYYMVEIVSKHFLDALELRSWFDGFANIAIYQEDLAVKTQERFDIEAEVKVTGSHPPTVEVIT